GSDASTSCRSSTAALSTRTTARGCRSRTPTASRWSSSRRPRKRRPRKRRPRKRRPRNAGALGAGRGLESAAMGLLERAAALEDLERWLGNARSGHGRLVLVEGEAGVGKTALLHEFAARHRIPPLLFSGCDPLGTPRPLGP